MGTKTCTGCGESRELSQFWRCSETKDGLRSKCKQCIYAQNTEWRNGNPERWASYYRNWAEENPERLRESTRKARGTKEYKVHNRQRRKKYVAQNPIKERARSIVRSMLASGKLARPAACPLCGTTGLVEAHHPNYEQPLWIVWCCKGCHMREFHRKPKAELPPLRGRIQRCGKRPG